jgi:hypothetical protein
VFESQDALNIARELIKLIEMHGDCPSIADRGRDLESMNFSSIREKLAAITIKEHTYCVTLNLIRAIKGYYTDYNVHIPGAVIAALAHDIGKIPALMDSFSDTCEHHIISAWKLTEMFSGKNHALTSKIISAVENHHSDSKDGFSRMLKQADSEARQTEILKLSQNLKVAPLNSWFRLEEFYKRLEPHINYSRGPASWKAFSFREIVYCRPELIYKIVKGLCEEAYIVDLMFLDGSAFEKALDKIVGHLRDYNMIPDQLKTTRFVGRYVIKTHNDRSYKVILTPVKPVGFYNMRELESRKIGFFEIIKSVRPV